MGLLKGRFTKALRAFLSYSCPQGSEGKRCWYRPSHSSSHHDHPITILESGALTYRSTPPIYCLPISVTPHQTTLPYFPVSFRISLTFSGPLGLVLRRRHGVARQDGVRHHFGSRSIRPRGALGRCPRHRRIEPALQQRRSL